MTPTSPIEPFDVCLMGDNLTTRAMGAPFAKFRVDADFMAMVARHQDFVLSEGAYNVRRPVARFEWHDKGAPSIDEWHMHINADALWFTGVDEGTITATSRNLDIEQLRRWAQTPGVAYAMRPPERGADTLAWFGGALLCAFSPSALDVLRNRVKETLPEVAARQLDIDMQAHIAASNAPTGHAATHTPARRLRNV